MRKLMLFVPILLMGIVLFRCSKTGIDEMSYPNSRIVKKEGLLIDSVSKKSESLGIEFYRIISKSRITREYKMDLIQFEIGDKNGTRRVTAQIADNGVLRIKPEKKDFANLSLAELNYNSMSLTISVNNKEHVLYLKNRYQDEIEYQKVKEVFDSNEEEINTLLSSSIDIMNFYKIELIRKEVNTTTPTVFYSAPALCPIGAYVTSSTFYDASRSVATTLSWNHLQGSVCSNAYCIGCVSSFGTDCFCIFQDYGCACTSKGCACNEPFIPT